MKNQIIDLRSDTVTKPSKEMLLYALNAVTGDDCYGDDLSVRNLEEYCSNLFKKESALFMPSGTMSNQIAIACFTNRGDEVITDVSYHVNFFESSQTSVLNNVTLNSISSIDGIINIDLLKKAIDSKSRISYFYARPKLLSIENTISSFAGKVYPLEILKELNNFCKEIGLPIYMDGARLFNACVSSGLKPSDYSQYVDLLSICFSKGLGAPFGSILIGSEKIISEAKRYRKWFGGALHQSGYMAQMAIYALENNILNLKNDHSNAKIFYNSIINVPNISIMDVETNFVMVDISMLKVTSYEFFEKSRENGLLITPWKEKLIRIVFHMNIDIIDVNKSSDIFIKVCSYFNNIIKD